MAFLIQELFHLGDGKNRLPPRESFKASSIRTAIAARFQGQERSLPNKGVGHSGTTRNLWENICPPQLGCLVKSFFNYFSCSTKKGTVLGEGSSVEGQDRVVATMSIKKFSDLPATFNCTLGSSPVMVICYRLAGWSGPLHSC